LKLNSSLWMMRAIQLAEGGRGRVEPNPKVGALVLDVKGRLISEGHHRFFGGPHAEVEALEKAGKLAKGGTLIVTLEPCSTYGKTPPCTDRILRSGIRRLIVGAIDPNPRHRGRGIQALRRHGIQITAGILSDIVAKQNAEFFKFMKTGIPYVSLKLAQSLDGKIATARGESRWISSSASRSKVQTLRALHQAILVGTNTLKKDQPRLTVRGTKGPGPRRIFIARDPNLISTFLKARDREGDILFFHHEPRFTLKKMKCARAPFNREGIRLAFLMNFLAQEGIASLLVEGGGEMAASFLAGKWVDKVYFFIAPLLVGGRLAKTSVEGKGVASLKKAFRLKEITLESLGGDILLQGLVRK
jgi:diaminohydroxyphosphoribosylaminopyrimidine deaminase/5-amino-6-(5-phosphoribosylamino)uracil reductase